MRFTQGFYPIFGLFLIFVLVCSLFVLPTQKAQALIDDRVKTQNPSIENPTKDAQAPNNCQQLKPTLSCTIPANPNRAISPKNTENYIGDFAWQTFVALNWPADCKGLPKPNYDDRESPRVWEFYNYPENIFLNEGKDPRNEGEVPSIVPPQCKVAISDEQLTPIHLTEGEGDPINILMAASRKPLIDQSGNYVLNEIRINPIEVKQIVDKGWYSADNLKNFFEQQAPSLEKAPLFELVCSEKIDQTENKYPCSEKKEEGAIEIKAAWKILKEPTEEIKSQYYTTTRTFSVNSLNKEADLQGYPSKKVTVTVPVALIGFHIVQKTSDRGWIWSTFEHKDNAPDDDDDKLPKSGHYNLYNPNNKCLKKNYSYTENPYLWDDQFPYAVTGYKLQEKNNLTGQESQAEIDCIGTLLSHGLIKPTPSQITRLVPITEAAKNLNKKWYDKMSASSIWRHYQLIGIQWLQGYETPYDKNLRTPQPMQAANLSQLVNVSLEPFIQTNQENGKSCITCHTFAKLPKTPNLNAIPIESDFSFLLNNAKSTNVTSVSSDSDLFKMKLENSQPY